MTFGPHRSRLVERIVTWVDANAPYYGTHRGKKNIKWKGDADFRPLPAAGE